jgi:hypothetical protein
MDRPSENNSQDAALILSDKLMEHHYLANKAGDALGMVDLTPETLGVPADPIRLMLQTVPMVQDRHGPQPSGSVPFLPLTKSKFSLELPCISQGVTS